MINNKTYCMGTMNNTYQRNLGQILLLLFIISDLSLNAQHYSEYARKIDSTIVGLSGISKNMKVGEIGAGDGKLACMMVDKVGLNGIVYANEINEKAVIDLNGLKLGNLKGIPGHPDDPKFPEKDLDIILMKYVLHDVETPMSLLLNSKKYLEENGRLIIIETHVTPVKFDPFEKHYMKREQLTDLLDNCGYNYETRYNLDKYRSLYVFSISKVENDIIWREWVENFRKNYNTLINTQNITDHSDLAKYAKYNRLLYHFRDDCPFTEFDDSLREEIRAFLEDVEIDKCYLEDHQTKINDLDEAVIRAGLGGTAYTLDKGDFRNDFKLIVENSDTIIADMNSGLMWVHAGSGCNLDYFDALEYVDLLNRQSYGNFNDWRLPSMEELFTIYEVILQANSLHLNPFFNITINMVWSCNTGDQKRKWALNFSDADGTVWEVFKHYQLCVLPVRGKLTE